MDAKICTGCGIEKPLSAFSPSKRGKFGINSRCKQCRADKWLRAWSPYKDRYQGELPAVVPGRHRFASDHARDLDLPQYRRTDTPSPGVKYTRRHPAKRAAHKVVEFALARGQLARQPCERCTAPDAFAHHEDYSKPLDVMWLCHRCHMARHRELRAMQKETA